MEIVELPFPIALPGPAGGPGAVGSEFGGDPDRVRVSGLIGRYIQTPQLPPVCWAELAAVGFAVVAKVGLPVDDVVAILLRCIFLI